MQCAKWPLWGLLREIMNGMEPEGCGKMEQPRCTQREGLGLVRKVD